MLLSCLLCATLLQGAQLVTVRNPSLPVAPGGNGDSSLPLPSADGRFVLFTSGANNLVVATNAVAQVSGLLPPLNVYLRDRSNAVTTLISVNLAGTNGGNGDSYAVGISTNGRYVLFVTSASDLVAGDTNNASDVLVRDLVAGTNILVSAATNGLPGNGDSDSAAMTPDGRYVAFVSAASNLVAGDTNGIRDVFVRDLVTGTTTLASAGAQSSQGRSAAPLITPDGRYVAFFSSATNLVPGIPQSGGEIYVRDLVEKTTIWASTNAWEALLLFQNATNPVSFGHVISADGQFVAYEVSPSSWPSTGIVLRYSLEMGLTDIVSTNAAILSGQPEDIQTLAMTPDGRFLAFTANPTFTPGLAACLYVWDALSNSTTLVSGDLSGAVPVNDTSVWPGITPDGRFVGFQSTATNLVTNSPTGDFHVYIRDLKAGITRLSDVDHNGVGSGVTAITAPHVTDEGRYVTFEAPDGSLVPSDAVQSFDVFMRDLLAGVTELMSKRDPALSCQSPVGPSTLSSLSVSADGSLVAFTSAADDLVLSDTNGYPDVFVRDLALTNTVLVSVDASGTTSGNGLSAEPSISADGRFVAFSSGASNLVAGDTNNASDVFVRDLWSGTTTLVSVNSNGFSEYGASYSPIITSDGRAVLFHSRATDPSSGFLVENLFWRDLGLATTYPVTAFKASFASIPVAVTPDGHYVAFSGPGLPSPSQQAWYVWDSQLQTNVYSSSVPDGNPVVALAISPDGNRIVYALASGVTNLSLVDRAAATLEPLGSVRSLAHGVPRFSADSRYLAYVTSSTNVPTGTNGFNQVYLYDCLTASNTLVSQPYNPAVSANGDSDSPDISPNGRFVAYRSAASNLVPYDLNGVPDVFLWDRLTGATMLLSVSHGSDSSANNRSLVPVFCGDGTNVLFESWASDLVSYDFNGWSDIFTVSLLSSGTIPLFRAAIVPGPSPGIWISWPAVPGKSYHVQFKNTLADPAWQDLGGSVSFVGAHAYLNDLAAPGNHRFYRVVAQ